MSDPAIEAARRAGMSDFPPRARGLAVDSAREALNPVRELHYPRELYLWATTSCWAAHETANDTETGDDICFTCTAEDGGPVRACAECFDNDGSNIDWPCATARLVYAEEELS